MSVGLGDVRVDILRSAHALRDHQAPIQQVINTLMDTKGHLIRAAQGTSREEEATQILQAVEGVQDLLHQAQEMLVIASQRAEDFGRTL